MADELLSNILNRVVRDLGELGKGLSHYIDQVNDLDRRVGELERSAQQTSST